MKQLVKLYILALLCGGMTTVQAENLNTFKLMKKNGSSVPYILKKDEIAIMGAGNIVFSEKNNAKKLFQHPSYTLFSINENTFLKSLASKEMAEQKMGLVFYQYGEKENAYRYISTGTILVTFGKKGKTDIDNFAVENNLKYLKTVSSAGDHLIILFANMSGKNDVELSSSLVKKTNVSAAKPNWILPLKLF